MNIKSVLLVLAAVAASASADETEQPAPVASGTKVASKVSFTTLPLCRIKEGSAEVRRPGEEWAAAVEGKYYPLGSSFRTGKGGSLTLAFGADSTVTVESDSEMATRAQALGGASRTVVLVRGTVNLSLADGLPEGAFFVTAPGFTVKNPAGKSRYVYEDKGDGDRVTVRCVTGTLGIEGRHFSIPTMHPADEVVIRTSHDKLATFLYGTSGDYVVRLDRGMRAKDVISDDGQIKHAAEKETVEWRLSPKMKIAINRLLPSVGERMSVNILVFDAAGEPQGSGICFSEGLAEINFGEIGAKEKMNGDELAKRAAEATETTEATDEEESSDEEKKNSDENTSEKKEEE